jgi:prepilin-type processing-associated H-X9-DG protein
MSWEVTAAAEAHYSEAEKLDKEAIAIRSRILGPDHPNTIATENNFANVLYLDGRYPEAEEPDQQVSRTSVVRNAEGKRVRNQKL